MDYSRTRFFNSSKKIHPLYWLPGAVVIITLIIIGNRESSQLRPIDSVENLWVRVLLAEDIRLCEIDIAGGYKVHDSLDGDLLIKRNDLQVFSAKYIDSQFVTNAGNFKVSSSLAIKPLASIFRFKKMAYRGYAVVVANKDGKTVDLINYVPLEYYLMGVIGAEMPSYWQSEALKAQAIAARTYCLYYKKTYGPKRNYDVRKSQANQVYKGIIAENKITRDIVSETSGQVMISDDEIFPAYYSSICGGHTDSSEDVFGKAFKSLQAVKCSYCIKVARKKQFYWKSVKFSAKELTAKLVANYKTIKPLGLITKIEPRKKSTYDGYTRWTNIKLTGKTGKTITLGAEDLRLSLDSSGRKLCSTIYDLKFKNDQWIFSNGRGFGHGVGMCQCGAQGLARDGKNYREILQYYYPGSEMAKIY